jgi:hypothetical protein
VSDSVLGEAGVQALATDCQLVVWAFAFVLAVASTRPAIESARKTEGEMNEGFMAVSFLEERHGASEGLGPGQADRLPLKKACWFSRTLQEMIPGPQPEVASQSLREG